MIEHLDRIGALLSSGDADGAATLVRGLEGKQPAAAELGRAAIALFERDAAAARAHATRALAMGVGSLAQQYLAAAALMAGDHAAAVDHARKAVAIEASPRARSSLGSILLAAGRADDAAAVLRQVVAESPRDAEALLNLGTASAQIADYGEAIASYARAFDRNPGDPRPIQNLIGMFAEIGRWLGAVAALELSKKQEAPPEVALALDLVMVHLVRLIAVKVPAAHVVEDVDRAVRDLAASAAGRPPRVQLVVARTLIDFGRIDEAEALVGALGAAVTEPADRGNLAYVTGFFAERRGDSARALAAYADALAADPRRTDACINSISLLLEDGSPAAFARIAELLELVPAGLRATTPELVFNEAVYHARAGRRDDARVLLERLTRGDGRLAGIARKKLDELAR